MKTIITSALFLGLMLTAGCSHHRYNKSGECPYKKAQANCSCELCASGKATCETCSKCKAEKAACESCSECKKGK